MSQEFNLLVRDIVFQQIKSVHMISVSTLLMCLEAKTESKHCKVSNGDRFTTAGAFFSEGMTTYLFEFFDEAAVL